VPDRVVITGGAGFLGSHLCDRMITEGHQVICLDNFCTGNPQNIAHLLTHPGFRLIECDVTDYLDVDGTVDAVLHFASPASPKDYLDLPIETLKVGSLGTMNALGLAKVKHARFLLASTSEVYGDPLEHPQGEEYWGNVNPNQTGPINIGSPDELTMHELADRIIAITGADSAVDFIARPEDDPTVRKPRIDLAAAVLGWKPQVGLEDGLSRTIQWFREAQPLAPNLDAHRERTPS
jgi:dTDP-glucose 4,6-dehydratase